MKYALTVKMTVGRHVVALISRMRSADAGTPRPTSPPDRMR